MTVGARQVEQVLLRAVAVLRGLEVLELDEPSAATRARLQAARPG